MSDPNIGRKISNRYELVELIGQGSMGKVYLAGDSLLGGVPVAVKFLSQTLLNEGMRTRFFREAMTCAQLGQKSMHVVRVTDYGVNEDDIPFYVMEYLKGENIGRLVHKKPLPVPRFLGLVRQILLGLRTAHNGILVKGEVVPIIHRDIKPSNILVTSDPSMGELVKILDFGIAKLMQAGSEQTSTFMGTLAYASPEQMEGRELDSRSDIYSLGVMMYQMLSGTLPVKPANNTFGGWYKVHRLAKPKPLTDFDSAVKVPKALEMVVMDCLAKHREDRPGTIDQIIEAIAPLEDRFGSGFQISQRINTTLSKLSVIGQPENPLENQPTQPKHQPQNSPQNSPQNQPESQPSADGREGTSRNSQHDQLSAKNNQHSERLVLPENHQSYDQDLDEIERLLADFSSSSETHHRAIPLEGSAIAISSIAEASADHVIDSESNSEPAQKPSAEDFYRQQRWPSEMPIAQIVFPRLLSQNDISVPTLWAMMPTAEIKQRICDTRYNNFMYTMTPHPMVLWLTAFYNQLEGPRWLPCYLDLKLDSSQKILSALTEARQYRLLFFSKEAPHECLHVRMLNVAASQSALFQEWTTTARSFPSIGSAQESKALLKRELETNLKRKIVMNFEARHSDSRLGLTLSP
jgi:eukaryotic-like serine/threonine-protein kinase